MLMVILSLLIAQVHFDSTITLGTVIELLTILTVIAKLTHSAFSRWEQFEKTLQKHGATFVEHSAQMVRMESGMNDRIARYEASFDERMERYEAGALRLVGEVQRVVGRLEEISDRRSRPRN